MMNAIDLHDLDAGTFEKVYSHSVSYFKNSAGSRGILIDPTHPSTLLTQHQSLSHNLSEINDFGDLANSMSEFRREIQKELEEGTIVVVFARARRCVSHPTHAELQISNYDWLWPGAGHDNYLYLVEGKCEKHVITDYGYNTLFHDYLKLPSIRIETQAQGNLKAIAHDEDRNAVAFIIPCKKGKIIFIPPCYSKEDKTKLLEILKGSLDSECWPPEKSLPDITPAWLEKYNFPEIKLFEQTLIQKEEQIARLEEECEYINRNLLQIKQLQKDLLVGNVTKMNNALAVILSQWGTEALSRGDSLKLTSGERSGIVLTCISEASITLWAGKKLRSILDEENCQKGILAVANHRMEDPMERDQNMCTPALKQFAEENDFIVVSVWDIFQAHCRGSKELLEILWTAKGMTSLAS